MLGVEEEIMTYYCDQCSYKSSAKYSKRSYEAHIKSMHSGQIFSCSQCNYTTKHKHGLSIHIKATHFVNVHKCQECKKSYKYKGDLNFHDKTELPTCGLCDKKISAPTPPE